MRKRGWILLLLVSLPLGACAASASGDVPASGSGGSLGSGGSSGVHCTTAACVPPLSTHLLWAVTIDPSAQSPAAFEENPSVDLYGLGGQLTLTAGAATTIGATFTAPANGSIPSTANAVLTVPSLIAGRPSLTFQAPTVLASSGSSVATLNVPSDRLGSPATVALVPLSPADQTNPPHSFSVALAASLPFSLPDDDLSLRGILWSAIAKPPTSTFVARAFQGGTQVSSAPPTSATDGSFTLVLPSVTAAGGPLTVQLTPQSQTDPWFISNSIWLSSSPSMQSLQTIMLPAYSNLNQFNLTVQGADTPNTKVSGAVVNAQTVFVETNSLGTTEFSRSAITDSNGVASLSLLPGSANAPRSYTLTVTLPVGSPYASQCPAAVSVTSGTNSVNTTSAQTIATISLALRPVLTGTVRDSFGYPVAGVSVTATPGPTAAGACTAAATSPSNKTTDAAGGFTLPLDPGTYQLDYDPPSGSSAPRFTELGVVVSGDGQVPHDLTLPVGGLVEGTAFLLGASQQPLASATVRIFEPRCASGATCTTPPWLRGQTVTNASGQFQIVVPLSP